MKKFAVLFLLVAALCVGCSSVYDIRLNNGSIIACQGKPKFDAQRSKWIYVDAFGKTQEIPAGRVAEVGPRSMEKDNGGQFK